MARASVNRVRSLSMMVSGHDCTLDSSSGMNRRDSTHRNGASLTYTAHRWLVSLAQKPQYCEKYLAYGLTRMPPSASLPGFRDLLFPMFGAVRIVATEVITVGTKSSGKMGGFFSFFPFLFCNTEAR